MKSYIFIILHLHWNLMKADNTNIDHDYTNSLLMISGQGYLFSYPTICSTLLDDFAEYASNFTKCSIKYARPIRLCEKCINNYIQFQDKYQELLTTIVNGTTCKSIFISHDRLNAVSEYHDGILAIWNKGNCNACYDWSNVDKPVLSNNTNLFNKMYKETIDCIVQNVNPGTNNSEVCETCMQSYLQLDDYYKSLSDDNIGIDSICMDIVDSMNATRSIWSKSLNCCQLRRTPEILFLCCTGIISVLPLFYYLAVKYCGPIRDLPNVLKQSRFKQTILRSVNGRVN